MKISENCISGTGVTGKTDQVQSAQTATRSDGKVKTSGAPGDRVEISGLTGQLAEALGAQDTSRAAHVSRVAEAVRTGRYQVDSAALSRSLVDDALARSDGRQ